MMLNSKVKHTLHCICVVSWLSFFSWATEGIRFSPTPVDNIDPWIEYGTIITVLIIFLRLLSFLALPQTLFNLVGLVSLNAFRGKDKLQSSPLLAPFICVRVVTRGLYPNLVKKTVKTNINTLLDAGIENFVLQVVTDKSIGLPQDKRTIETVVPTSYKTKSGALNKARALQYCLEDDVSVLGEEDWIVHLDEETLLTEGSVRGILNFITDGTHSFGQGLITYANNPVKFKSFSKFFQNRICTVADSFRVADDMGKLRCQLTYFNKPLFGWKGSYAGAEKKVSFDWGPDGSKAEDCFFGIVALDQGYSFGFIQGEMQEKSPFTFQDLFKQRKRWMQLLRYFLPHYLFFLASWLTMPLTTSNVVLTQIYPMSVSPTIDFLLSLIGGVPLYMYMFGYIKQFPIHRYSWFRSVLSVIEIALASVLSIIVENLAVICMWGGDWYDFYIVEKDNESEQTSQNIV
ncbi:beta-1,4-mannosyltransferase egh [Eurytemora carolleeae]|uniref:beta-1,4-mannosyltransferase egh n=1 Tax=Eurytemora carolleeae TaxID=1294199 RepID=UPI000C76A116|nr:beta-1,4-mannosyltransferase egh [Eurytemora carolleeae]|eukprot:XP_023334273.1 beta-1,4-mannosyltransferase egh-like [Eurytemora affinis]